MIQKWFHDLLGDKKKTVNLLVCLGVAGMILLAVSEWLPSDGQSSSVKTSDSAENLSQEYAAQLEEQLCDLLGRVDGAGAVKVMITLQSGSETVYAKDTHSEQDGSYEEEPSIPSGSAQALVESVQYPAVEGVAVVCEGGGNASVAEHITEIVAALTGIGTNHISVIKMASD